MTLATEEFSSSSKNQSLSCSMSPFTAPAAASVVSNHGDSESYKTWTWWYLLSTLSLFNCAVWIWTCTVVEAVGFYQQAHIMLSGIYVFVCTYRSILPRIDLERYCLVDTHLSSVFLGRSAATIAELSFATQLALFFHELGEITQFYSPKFIAHGIVPTLALAQVFCWCGVLSLNHFYHAIEESLWAIVFAAMGLALIPIALFWTGRAAFLAAIGIPASAGYVFFMCMVDVPMYLERWREGIKSGKSHMSFRNGGKDSWNRRVVTDKWKHWKGEVAWLTGYFSFAVWTSLLFVHFPLD